MGRLFAGLLMLAVIGSPASAQVLQCKTNPTGTTYCNTAPGRTVPTLPTPGGIGGGILPGAPVGYIPPTGVDATLARGRADAAADRKERERIARAQTVADLISQGRCDDARTVAMNAGDFTMAERAMSLCRAR